jgi:hypothetical protein
MTPNSFGFDVTMAVMVAVFDVIARVLVRTRDPPHWFPRQAAGFHRRQHPGYAIFCKGHDVGTDERFSTHHVRRARPGSTAPLPATGSACRREAAQDGLHEATRWGAGRPMSF